MYNLDIAIIYTTPKIRKVTDLLQGQPYQVETVYTLLSLYYKMFP